MVNGLETNRRFYMTSVTQNNSYYDINSVFLQY